MLAKARSTMYLSKFQQKVTPILRQCLPKTLWRPWRRDLSSIVANEKDRREEVAELTTNDIRPLIANRDRTTCRGGENHRNEAQVARFESINHEQGWPYCSQPAGRPQRPPPERTVEYQRRIAAQRLERRRGGRVRLRPFHRPVSVHPYPNMATVLEESQRRVPVEVAPVATLHSPSPATNEPSTRPCRTRPRSNAIVRSPNMMRSP
jgi:hypothetical protein